MFPSLSSAVQYHLGQLADTRPIGAVRVCDLASLCSAHAAWRRLFPQLHACCCSQSLPHAGLAGAVAGLGAALRVRSKQELLAANEAGVAGASLLLDNPCKMRSLLAVARRRQVAMTTFDSEAELEKLADCWPEAKLLLMLRPPAAGATELGADPDTVPRLLASAKSLGLRVAGFSLAMAEEAEHHHWLAALHCAREAFGHARRLGIDANLLDIGNICDGNQQQQEQQEQEADDDKEDNEGDQRRQLVQVDRLRRYVLPALERQFSSAANQPLVLCDPTNALLANAVVTATRVAPGPCAGADCRIEASGVVDFDLTTAPRRRPTIVGVLTDDGYCGEEFFADCCCGDTRVVCGEGDAEGEYEEEELGFYRLPQLVAGDWILWRGAAASWRSGQVNRPWRTAPLLCCLVAAQLPKQQRQKHQQLLAQEA